MPANDRMSSMDSSVDPTFAVVSYAPKWYILAYAGRTGYKQLHIDYGNDDPGLILPPPLMGHPGMAVYNGVVYLAHQDDTDNSLWHMTYNGDYWSPDTLIPNIYLNESPGMAVFNGILYLAHQGAGSFANTLWYTVSNERAWSQDKQISGVKLNGSPSMAALGGTLYVFYQGIDTATLRYTRTSDGKNWSAESLVPGASMRNSPSAAVRDGVLYVAYHGSDDTSIYYVTYDGNDWSAPVALGGDASEVPIADRGSPALFLDTTDNHLMVVYPDGNGISTVFSVAPSESLPPSVDPTVASVIYNSDLIQAHADYSGNKILNVVYANEQTTQPLSMSLNGYPAMAVFNGVVHLTHRTSGTDQTLWHTTYDGKNWPSDTPIPDVYLNESPGMAVFQENLYVAHQGSDVKSAARRLCYTVFDGKVWSKDYTIPIGAMNGSPSMAVVDDVLYLFFRGSDGASLWYTTTSDGKSWPNQWQVPGVSLRNSPSAAVRDGALYVAYHGKDDASIWYVEYDASKWSQPVRVVGTTTIYPISDGCSPTLFEDIEGNLKAAYTSAKAYDVVVSVVPPEEPAPRSAGAVAKPVRHPRAKKP